MSSYHHACMQELLEMMCRRVRLMIIFISRFKSSHTLIAGIRFHSSFVYSLEWQCKVSVQSSRSSSACWPVWESVMIGSFHPSRAAAWVYVLNKTVESSRNLLLRDFGDYIQANHTWQRETSGAAVILLWGEGPSPWESPGGGACGRILARGPRAARRKTFLRRRR